MKRTNDEPRRQRKGKRGDVIHVHFGPGGGRVPASTAPSIHPSRVSPSQLPPPPSKVQEPVTAFFSRREVARLLGLSESRLSALDRAQIVSPSSQSGRKRVYSFQDLIALRATLLLAKDVKLAEVKRAISALRESLPKVTRPLQELRLVSDGRRVVVRSEYGSFEPVTGQLVMNFELSQLKEDVVRFLRPSAPEDARRTAYDLYVRASGLDEAPETLAEAEALYRQALEIDPHLAIAYTNLGNVRFRQGDVDGAFDLYRKALDLDERQPEAHYNLGYVCLERGDTRDAVDHFEHAIGRDPRFADAHFNLAVALEQMGATNRARLHWRTYLDIEPAGPWADVAKGRLGFH